MRLTGLAEALRRSGCTTEEQVPMKEHTSFKIGGPADILATAADERAVARAAALCRGEGIPLLLLGNGSNLLVDDGGIRGVTLRLSEAAGPRETGRKPDGRVEITCPAGVPLKQLCRFARDKGLAGLEFAYGIPGTAGGAAYMNAGAYGGEMKDVMTRVQAVTEAGEIRYYPASSLCLSYRHSDLMENGEIVTAVTVELTTDDPAAIGARMEEFMRRRREKQPLEYPSAGSFFKRPPGLFAGTLIEGCGLKGLTVGGAQVSEKHAGFLINRGGATSADVRELARQVRERVHAAHGVWLEPEVRFVGGPERR